MGALTLHPTAEKVVELLEPHIERQGYVLVSVDFRKVTRNSLLRLLVDKPGGGIALSDLEKLSPTLGDLLDVYDPVEGERVKVRTHRARDGQKSFIGKLVSVGEIGIELDDETSRKRQTIGFDEMSGANYEYDFDK